MFHDNDPMGYFRRTPVRYRTVLVTAGLLAALFLLQSYTHHSSYQELKGLGDFNWWREAPVPFLNFLFWALLCPMVYAILLRWPFSERPLVRTIAIHLGLGLSIAALHELTTSAVYYGVLQATGEFDLGNPVYRDWAYHALLPGVFSRAMEYGVLMAVLAALENARLRRLEHEQLLDLRNELQTTQLNALKKQLQPHFLFNTLNTVSALMDEDIGDARRVLARLGHLLRATLDGARRDKVSLASEVEHIGNYLGIEAVRYRDRLRVDYDIPPELRSVQVPGMLLQPLVENAIKHGPDAVSGEVRIAVRAQRDGDRLVLRVSDDGQGCADTAIAMDNGGIGLRNTRDRLRLLYGDESSFSIASPGRRGFHVTISFPIGIEPNTNGHEAHPDDHRGR